MSELREALEAYEEWGLAGFNDYALDHYTGTVTLFAAARSWLNLLDDENVEAAAKAIYEGGLTDEHPKWVDQDAEAQGWYRASARAALRAVRDRSTG